MSERLQLDPALTLDKAKRMIRQREAVQEDLKGTSRLSGDIEKEATVGSRYPVRGFQPVKEEARNTATRSNVHAVAKNNMLETSTLLKMQHVSNAAKGSLRFSVLLQNQVGDVTSLLGFCIPQCYVPSSRDILEYHCEAGKTRHHLQNGYWS